MVVLFASLMAEKRLMPGVKRTPGHGRKTGDTNGRTNMNTSEIVKAANAITAKIVACTTEEQVTKISDDIDQFNQQLKAKAKHDIDIELIDTYNDWFVELISCQIMKITTVNLMK